MSLSGRTAPVLVVGAGPAGCAAALSLKRRGVAVKVVDRALFPRDKVCGDMLIATTLDELAMLGLPVAELRARGAVECPGVRFAAPSGRFFSENFRHRGRPRPSLNLKRLIFDAWLVEQLERAGVEVLQGVEVRDLCHGSDGAVAGVLGRDRSGRDVELAARWVIGADGAGSNMARALGLGKVEPANQVLAARGYVKTVDPIDPRLWTFGHADLLPGCLWLLPVGSQELNVGLGFLATKTLEGPPKRVFERLSQALPGVPERLGAFEINDFKGWFLPLATSRRPMVGNGVVLIGDAAHLIDPLTGHGIHNALRSGRLVGEVLARGDERAVEIARLEHLLGRGLKREACNHLASRRLSGSPTLTELMTATAHILPPLRRWVIGQIGHCRPLKAFTG